MNEKVNLKNLGLAILVGILASALIVNAGYIGDPSTTIRHDKFSLIPYKWAVEQFNSTAYQSWNSTGWVIQSLDDQALIQACIDDTTPVGGEILIVAGSYSATITLKTNIRLVIEKGATGITVTIDSGATCILEDYQNSITWYYSSGVLLIQYNNLNGLITGIYSNFLQYWSGVNNRTDAVVNPIQPCSYIIDIYGSTYRMKNCTDGQIPYQSTDFDRVFDFTQANMTRSGAICLRTGTYNSSGLRITTNASLTLIGEERDSTILNIVDSAAGAISRVPAFTDRAAILVEASNSSSSITLKDFTIHGNCERQTRDICGILVRAGSDFEINNVYVNGSSRFGIRTYSPTGKVEFCHVYELHPYGAVPAVPTAPYYDNLVAIHIGITDCEAKDNEIGWIGQHGVVLEKGVGIWVGTSATVARNWIWSCRTAVYVAGSDAEITDNFIEANYELGIWIKGSDNKVTDNRIRMGGTDTPVNLAGIWISGGSKNEVSNNKIYCRDGTYTITYGILENSTAYNNFIVSNEIDSTSRGNILYPINCTSLSTVVFNNDGCLNNLLASDAMVWKDTTITKVLDRYGNIIFVSLNDTLAANYAADNLMSDTRDYYKTMVMVGNFTVDHAIPLYNYTEFKLIGKITLKNDLQNTTHPDILHMKYYYPSTLHDIIVDGGVYDGNRQNGNNLTAGSGVWNFNGLNGIYFATSANITIRNLVIENCGTVDLHFDSCNDTLVQNVKLLNPYFHACHYGGDPVNNNAANATWIDVYVEGPPSRPSQTVDRENDGGALCGSPTYGFQRYIRVVINGSYAQGLSLSSAATIESTIVDGCSAYKVGLAGISAGGQRCIITNCIVRDCNRLALVPDSNYTDSGGIYTNCNLGGGIISGNIVTGDNQGYGIRAYGSNVLITSNVLESYTDFGSGLYVGGENQTYTDNIVLGFRRSVTMYGGSGNGTSFRFNELKPHENWFYISTYPHDPAIFEWNDVNGTSSTVNASFLYARYNRGFRTEYSASAVNATVNTWTFTPNMDMPPLRVLASFNSTQVDAWKWSYVAGTITITCSNTVTTDQIVACYIEAYSWNYP
jgi:hypothetical protein